MLHESRDTPTELYRPHLVFRHRSSLQVGFNVPRVKVRNTHQKTRSSECPQFPETEQWLEKMQM